METFTFYSYKGGSGRSLLVANAARYLASLGKRVVAIDFDLEAPGLHYKMRMAGATGRTGDVAPARGVVDYLLAVAAGETDTADLSNYVWPIPLPAGTQGSLHLMPAGAAPSGQYWQALAALTRRDFFADPDGAGIAACLELKSRIEEELKADCILIDSRTGITEMAGLATSLLADTVVCVMIDNQESLAGARAVMRSFGRAPRLTSQDQIKVMAVLSRVPEDSSDVRNRVLRFLNEAGPSKSETLTLERVFVLRVDPELAAAERLYIGSGESKGRSRLHQDYLALLEAMVTADHRLIAAAARRHEALAEIKAWLTERGSPRRRDIPDPFDEDQIGEGVELGNHEKRYADMIVYGSTDRNDTLMAVEYVEDLPSSKVWQWWERNTSLRCVMLIGKEEGGYLKRRVFTRRRGSRNFRERDEQAGWIVKWPASFTALDDPGDRSIDSMLRAVQRGEGSFIGLLVTEWQHSSFVTLHGGAPYRPRLARRILDGLAAVTDHEMEMRVLWRTAPDPFDCSFEKFGPGMGSLEAVMTRELHAPLWWRLSVEAKVEYSGHRGRMHEVAPLAGLDLLARDLMGLTIDQDADFRREARQIFSTETETNDGEVPAYRLLNLLDLRELKFEISEDPSPELTRRAALDYLISGSDDRDADSVWRHAEHIGEKALGDRRSLSRLLHGTGNQPQFVAMGLLAQYEPQQCRVIVYPALVDWAADQLGIEVRALANVAFLHATVYAVCHLGRDLDGRMWADFGMPPATNVNSRPSLMLETMAHYFSYRLIQRLEDAALMLAFDRLDACEPAEYRVWHRLREAPVEEVRKILLRARAGLDATSWSRHAN